MSKGTYTPPKPPTAKQMEKMIAKYEISFNEIVEATKKFDPASIAGQEGAWIRRSALELHGQLHALHDYLADEEREQQK